jgi:hypothetical protein
MQRSLLRNAGLVAFVIAATALVVTGCINEPDPPVKDHVTSSVRFVHAVPAAAAMDVWVDAEKLGSTLDFMGFSAYLTVNSGNRFIRLVPAGQDTSTAVFRRAVSVRSYSKMTMAFYGATADIQLLVTQERFTYADETSRLVDSADVKLINLNSGPEVYYLAYPVPPDSISIMTSPSVSYGNLTAYTRAISRTGDLYILKGDKKTAAVTFTNFEIKKPGYRYTFIVVGTAGNTQAVALQDEP